MIKIKKIGKAAISTIQNLSGPIADVAVRLQTISPEWGLAVGMGSGLLAVWRELAQDRGVELLEFIEQHKTEFAEKVIATPNFKAVFLSVWEMHIRENSENKRKRLRNFLLNLGKGEEINKDEYTKIYSIINQMTDTEAEGFGLIIKNTNREQYRSMHMNTLSWDVLSKFTEEELQDLCHSLHSYRLLNIVNAQIGKGMVITQITPFGEKFFDFVCDEK